MARKRFTPEQVITMLREEDDLKRIASKGWAAMIRKAYEVDPMLCPQFGETMKIIAFITEYAVVDRIIDHLKLTFVAERPPPPGSLIKSF